MRRALALFLLGCGGGDAPKDVAALCATTLPPKAELPPLLPSAPVPPETRPSRVVLAAEVELASLLKDLESSVAPRIAEEHGHGIGVAGHLNYTVDRGPFRATVAQDALVVRTDIRARAEACRGASCYASCAPEGRATATVSLRLGADYRFARPHVDFAFTRGCEVKVLGGLLRFDVTEAIAAQLQPALRRVEQQIDASLPKLGPRAQQLWAELAKPRPLPLGGCATVNARGLVQGPITGTPETLNVRLGVIAYPELRSQPCEAAAPPFPLPPLAQDPTMPPEDEVLLGLVSPLSSAARALEGGAFTHVSVVQSGAQAQVDVAVHGAACGEAAGLANVVWTDALTLHFDAPDIVTRSTFAPAFDPNGLAAAAGALADPGVTMSAKVSGVRPAGVVLRKGEIVASVLARGSVALRQK